jgi:hypothetical protein
VVVHGITTEVHALVAEAVDDLLTAGWLIAPAEEDGAGLATTQVGGSAGRALRTATVRDRADIAQVVLAALRGEAVVVAVDATRAVTEQLCDELRRLGDLQVRSVDSGWPPLGDDDRRILDLLAAGMSLGRAAEELHLSRRSADRRLAALREWLGVRTSGEAVAVRRRRRAASAGPPC